MDKKIVIVTGCQGQLAIDIIKELEKFPENFVVYQYNRQQLDVTNHQQVKEIFNHIKPDIFFQLASYHNVEQIEDNIDETVKVNVSSLHTIAKLCQENNTLLINFSTNYVYSGSEWNESDQTTQIGRDRGYIELTDPEPLNVYGILKYTGEQIVNRYCSKHFNFRVAGLFGITGSRAKNNTNFPISILNKLKNNEEIKCVDDQYMNVTYTKDAAKAIVKILNKFISKSIVLSYGTFNLTNLGILTWFDLANFIAESKGMENRIIPVKTAEFYSNIKRPLYSALSIEKIKATFNIEVPSWQSGMLRFLNEYANHTNQQEYF